MFDLRLKRAQVALAGGRLDEAYDVLSDPKLTAHRTGQKLISRLSKAFIDRGRGHLAADRLAAAMEDCNRAEKLAGNLADVMELRRQICEAVQTARLQSQQDAEQLNKAREQFENGWLSTGRKILKNASGNQQAGVLLKNAEMLQVETDSASSRIEKALKHNQIELAAQIHQNSALKDCISEQAILLLNRIQQQAADKIRLLLQAGDINGALSFLNRLNGPATNCEEIAPLRRAVSFCVEATSHIQSGHFSQAATNLKKARTLLPKTGWIKEALDHIQQAQTAAETLQSGPLGILESTTDYPPFVEKRVIPQKKTLPVTRFEEQSALMEACENKMIQFLLQLDGIGAYYVYCGERVTIGPVSSSVRSDIEVIAAPDVQIKQIQRFEEDYFLSDLKQSISRPASQQLLTEGARLELSPRCRFKFTVPNPASSTACLIPSSAKLPRADVNGIILMKREILIGPGRNCHIQTGQISDTITLYLQDRQIRCRSAESITVDNRPIPAGNGLPMNQPVQIGSTRMTLTTRQH